MNIVVIYDSQTGNTEKMAHAIAEGAGSVEGVEVEVKKVGEPFPMSKLTDADGVFFGSPCIYANVTPAMQSLLGSLSMQINVAKVSVKGKPAAIFGSYGWDGAWVMEELLTGYLNGLGYKVHGEVCVEVGTSIQYHPDDHLGKCRDWAKAFVESLK